MLGSFPFDEAVGVQRESGAAGISPELKAPWEEQTLARLRRVPSSDVCTAAVLPPRFARLYPGGLRNPR